MRRKLIKIGLIFFVMTAGPTLAYVMVMPQATRCLLIDLYDFENNGALYYRTSADPTEISNITSILKTAKERNALFWSGNKAEPKFIYCDSDEDYRKFGSTLMTPAAAHLSFRSFVVISKSGIDLDILAHEISHTELSARVGILNRASKIPIWFDEGIAMQVDHRDFYSLNTLAAKSDGFRTLPEVETMDSNEFLGGSKSEVMLNYMTAKYKISLWLSNEKLNEFLEKINEGQSFESAYN